MEARSAQAGEAEKPGELRLVLLGRSGSGKSDVGNAILDREEFVPHTEECVKGTAVVAGRQVILVNTPDWFRSERPPDQVKQQISSCVALASPGPHAFILCVPLDRPMDAELQQAPDAIAAVFGPGALKGHTLVLVTRGRDLGEPETALVARCGGRYHLREDGIAPLLEKVEQMVAQAGGDFYTCSPAVEREGVVRQGGKTDLEFKPPSSEAGEEEVEEEVEQCPEESTDDFTLATVFSLGFLRRLWTALLDFLRDLPGLVRPAALLGSFVSLFVGGPLGSAVGTTVGSVVTEVGKRKGEKEKKK